MIKQIFNVQQLSKSVYS